MKKRKETNEKKKRILILAAYFYPETVASNQMTIDYCEELGKTGYKVTIYCPLPSRGISNDVRKKYKKLKKETLSSGVIIKRFNLSKERKNFFLRFLRYLIQNIKQFFYALFHKYDILFLSSTPPTNGFIGGLLRIIKKRKFIYYLHDVFPDSMVNMGLMREKSLLWKIGRKLENFTYKHSDRIIAVSNGIKNNIENKGVDCKKIDVVYNWVNEESITHVEKNDNVLVKEYGIDLSKFIVCYAGNIGAAQCVETIIKTAILMKNDNSVLFVIIGNGVKEEECKKLASDKDLNNIIFIPMQAKERLSDVYSLGDVSIVTCKKGFGNACMPSKAASIMATSTMILASFDLDSELSDIINKYELGICVAPEDEQELKNAINKILELNINCLDYGKRGRQFLENNMTKKICTNKIISVIDECI